MYAMNPRPLQARPYIDSQHQSLPTPLNDVADSDSPRKAAGSSDGGRLVGESTTRTGELTMSFEGEVYVFPAVTPQKVNFNFLCFSADVCSIATCLMFGFINGRL